MFVETIPAFVEKSFDYPVSVETRIFMFPCLSKERPDLSKSIPPLSKVLPVSVENLPVFVESGFCIPLVYRLLRDCALPYILLSVVFSSISHLYMLSSKLI